MGDKPAGLSPTSSYLSPTSFHLSPTSFHLSPRLGACGRVPGRLVSHLLLFISQFFSFVSHAGLSPTSLNVSPTSFHLLLRLGACGPVLVSEVRHCWCHVAFLFICLPGLSLLAPALFVGHAAFLFISLPGLSLLVSALFRWRCNVSIHLFSRSVTAGVCPFPLGMQHFYSFVSHVISFFLSFRFGACAALFCPWNRFACERFLLLARGA